MEKQQSDFHIAEFTALRGEMATQLKAAQSAVLLSLGGNSIIVSWISTQLSGHANVNGILITASWVPLVLTAIAWIFCRDRMRSMWRIAEYVKHLEQRLASEGLGWETYLDKLRAQRTGKGIRTSDISNFIFFSQASLSICFACYITAHV
jgi:hypothetical protein